MARILIIEDDEDLRPALARVLADAGYDVMEAREGKAGIEVATSTRPDLIITDIVMEGMEGIAVIMALRKKFGALPILTMSGNTLYLDNSEKLGADAALLKPFSSKELLSSVLLLLHGDVNDKDPNVPCTIPA